MKDFFIQIGIGIVMTALFVVTIIAIGLVWASVLLYSTFQWLVTNDGYTHNKCKCGCGNINKLYKPLDPKLEQEFNVAFSKKPFPKPYSPTDNPLFRPTPEELAKLKAKLPPFDREKVFKAVDDSNVRMSNKTFGRVVAEVTFNEILKKANGRHTLRGEKGQFIKGSQTETPITRYGVPTNERFEKNQ